MPWLVGAALLLVAFRKPVTEEVETIVAITSQDAIANRAKFLPYVIAAEKKYGIPSGMLDRLITQESHYRTDIITGTKKSATGAAGIAQFMPATARDLGVNPLDPIASIDAAGKYLKTIYGWVGNDWVKAVAAYNWGAGNVKKAVAAYGTKWLSYAPTETRNYVTNVA